MNEPKSKNYFAIRKGVRILFWTVCAAWGLATYAMFLNLLFS